MKPILIALGTLAWMPSTVMAKHPAAGQTQQQNQDQQKQQREQEKANRKKRSDAVQAVLEAKDTNHDGSLSLEEYVVGEADAAAAAKAFDRYNKNKDRFLSKGELIAALGL